MTNEELLEALNKRFDSIDSRLDKLETDASELKESAEVTRDAVNKILEWTDEISQAQEFPLPKVQ